MSLIAAGYYEAKIMDYGIKTTKAGDPAPTIAFSVILPDGGNERVFWQGSFKSEVSTDIALKALISCGLERGEDLPSLAKGIESGLLDTDTLVQVKVEHERDQNDHEKIYARIGRISSLGASNLQNTITAAEAAPLMANLNLSATFAQIKSKMPKPKDAPIPAVGF